MTRSFVFALPNDYQVYFEWFFHIHTNTPQVYFHLFVRKSKKNKREIVIWSHLWQFHGLKTSLAVSLLSVKINDKFRWIKREIMQCVKTGWNFSSARPTYNWSHLSYSHLDFLSAPWDICITRMSVQVRLIKNSKVSQAWE